MIKGIINVKSEMHGPYVLAVSVIWCNNEALKN